MKTSILKVSAMALVGAGLLFTSCRKDRNAEADNTVADEQSVSLTVSNELADIADDATDQTNSDLNFKIDDANDMRIIKCANLTWFNKDTTNNDTVVVDFGNGTSTCKDGKVRSGQITIIYTGGRKFKKFNANATITSNNYTVNGHLFNGTKTLKNISPVGGNLKYEVIVNATITTKNGNVLTYTANRTREWIAGASTPKDRSDDVIQVTGTESATNTASGRTWTATVINPLVRKFAAGCKKHFVQGILEIQITGKPTRTIDYGNGVCDNTITVTVNGKTYTITLK
jgi:hypothetical protein